MTATVKLCVRKTLVAVLIASLVGPLPGLFAPSTAQASTSRIAAGDSVVLQSAGAQAAWGFMVDEAVDLLARRGMPASMSQTYLRDEIRAYVIVRLMGIVRKDDASRTDAEKGALTYLAQQVSVERGWTAYNAYQRYNTFVAPSDCTPESDPETTFNIKCLLTSAFGDHPGVVAFTGAGYDETTDAFFRSRAAVPLAGAVKALPFWASVEVPGATAEETALLEELKDVYAEQIGSEAAREVVQEVGVTIAEVAAGESPSGFGLALLGLAVGAIVGYGIWNSVDLTDVANTLAQRKDSAASEAVDLTKLIEPAGLTELFHVVVAETLPMGTSEQACSFDSGLSCFRYVFSADPDFVAARYGDQPSPAHVTTDPHFLVQEKDQATITASVNVQLQDVDMSLWKATIPDYRNGGYTFATNYDPTATRLENELLLVAMGGSHLSQGMFVNSINGNENFYWRYSAGIDYVDWSGAWWNAWLQNGTMLHTRVATPLQGFFTPTDEQSLAGIFPILDGCVENPPFYFGTLGGFNPVVLRRGTCLLLSNGGSIGDLKAGDRLLIDGATRTVKSISTCQHYTSFLSPATDCTDHAHTAVILEQTGSSIEDSAAANSAAAWGWRILGLTDHPGFGYDDNLVMKMSDHDTCAGYAPGTCPYPSGDIRNCLRPNPGVDVPCFQGPTINYQSGGTSLTQRFWSATLVQALKAVPDAYTASVNVPALPDNTLNVSSAGGVLINDINATQTAVVTSSPAHGTVALSTDGSFAYTPEVGYGANAPQPDAFTYRICDGGNVVPGDPELCSEAVVSLTVENAPPTASISWFGSPASPGQVGINYNYQDRESDREGLTTYAWYRDDHTGPIATGRAYIVSQPDEGHRLWFGVTPVAMTGTSPGREVLSDKKLVSSTTTIPNTLDELRVNCGPLSPAVQVNSPRTCTATVTDDEDVPGVATTPKGIVGFRSTEDGTFSADSCTLTNFVTHTFSASSSCSVVYTPHSVGDGLHTVVGLWTGDGQMEEKIAKVAVVAPAPPPVAANDGVSTLEDTPLTLARSGLLSNDTGLIDASGFSVVSGTGPAHGALADQGDGTLLYTPAANYHGPDAFDYQVCDSASQCDTATVSITILSVNDPPVAAIVTQAGVECTSAAGAVVSLDGSSSSDVDSTAGTNDDIVSFEWYENFGAADQTLLGNGATLQPTLAIGSHAIILRVTDQAGATSTTSTTVVVADTTPPVLTCPTIAASTECTGPSGTPVALVASAHDACGGVTIINDRSTGGADASGSFTLGTTTVGFVAVDAAGHEVRCSVPVTIVDTTPPVLSCPTVASVECAGLAGAAVPVVATASDTCAGTVVVSNDHTAGGADASGTYPLGTTTVHFSTVDPSGNPAGCSTPVRVQDTTPPVLTVSVQPTTLWPPNHRMVEIDPTVTAVDACGGPSTIVLSGATSSEADDTNGVGDGQTTQDIQGAALGTADFSLSLRAERDGTKNGRVYTLVYTATDSSGNVSSTTGEVLVPHDERAITEPVALTIEQEAAGTTIAWDAVPDALLYSVVRGEVANLRDADNAIDLGEVTCLQTGGSALSTVGREDADEPPVGHAFFYLVSYNDGWGSTGYGTPLVGKPRIAASGDCR